MAQISVSPLKLRDAAQTLMTSSKEFMAIMDESKSDMERLRSKWESEAAEEFRAQFARLDTNIKTYDKAINDFSIHINFVADEYEKNEKQNLDSSKVLDSSVLFS